MRDPHRLATPNLAATALDEAAAQLRAARATLDDVLLLTETMGIHVPGAIPLAHVLAKKALETWRARAIAALEQRDDLDAETSHELNDQRRLDRAAGATQ